MSDTANPNPDWYPDPTGRYEQRYWDGTQWTEHVSSAGQQRTDPLPGSGPDQRSVTEPEGGADLPGLGDLTADTGPGAPVEGESPAAEPVAAEPVAAEPVAAGPAPDWYPDPTGRYEQRYWDGTQWTEHAVTGGRQAVDPLPAPEAATSGAEAVGVETPDQGPGATESTPPNPFAAAAAPAATEPTDEAGSSPPPVPGVQSPTDTAEQAASVPAPAAAGPEPNWYPDPTGRHELRYWDGSQWTDHVTDAGVPATDPVDQG